MERVQIINDISTFLEKSREDLHQILDKIGWDKEGLEKDAKKAVCPVDGSHVVPSSSLADHVEKCKLKKEMIDTKEVCPSSHFFYKNSLAVVPVLIDKKKYESFKFIKKEPHRETSIARDGNKPWECLPSDLDDIVEGVSTVPHVTTNNEQSNTQNPRPKAESVVATSAQGKIPNNGEETLQDVQASSDLQLPMSKVQFDLSSGQRLAVYDYVVQTAKAIKRRAADDLEELQHMAENTGDEKDETVPKSHLDTLAEMRDYKRRRQSYRAKNVHMTKRSNIEVMRDLIETQMKMLEELNEDEHNIPESTKDGQRTRFDQDDNKEKSRIGNSREYDRHRERRKEERHRN